MPLRIGIDARTLLDERPTGVERVVYHYLESLTRVAPPTHEYVLFVHRELPGGPPFELPGGLVVVPESAPRLQRLADVWLGWQMRSAMVEHRLDAFVSLNTKFPLSGRAIFTTVHGLEWYFCASEYPLVEKVKQWVWFQLCSRLSAGMITFARHTDEDIRRIRPRCTVPTCVVPEGVGPQFRRLAPAELSPETLARLGVRPPFVLSVCSLEPRKNIPALVRAFAAAVREHDLPHQLVLLGRSGWRSLGLQSLIADLDLRDRVVLPGYVSDAEVLQAYNQAEVFVYPSKYEGFGLPLVEAMACGVPIVTSNASSTREVAGDAAVLVDPHDERDIAAGLSRCLLDPGLRGRLVAAGSERVKRYTWETMTLGICEFISRRLGEESEGHLQAARR